MQPLLSHSFTPVFKDLSTSAQQGQEPVVGAASVDFFKAPETDIVSKKTLPVHWLYREVTWQCHPPTPITSGVTLKIRS
ncbi:hypothetical protein Y1Q_0009143 [Alligator mississippiensis]|uniref:Uncharacterized protein n=1 Tax=Alligator mississippiensis TaxID=8496 RepID=A0A151M2J6_ALLMI|nr:hypothetical protein Y1Q_0009143 [Alligator mississippiensis]